MNIDDVFIQENNKRILSKFTFQPREFAEKKPKPEFSEHDYKFLSLLCAQPYKFMLTEVFKKLDLGGGKGERIKEKLYEKGLIQLIEIHKGHGGKKVYPILLPDGYKLLNMQEPKFEGKGCGYEHLLYQHLIKEHFIEYSPVIELIRGKKSMDVACEIDGNLIALEVAMTASHEKINLEKDVVLAGAYRVVIGCIDEKVKGQVVKDIASLPDEMKSKAMVCRLSEVFKIKLEELIKKEA
jgi:hypothetical protein